MRATGHAQGNDVGDLEADRSSWKGALSIPNGVNDRVMVVPAAATR